MQQESEYRNMDLPHITYYITSGGLESSDIISSVTEVVYTICTGRPF
jgi:hypothetical protein